MTKLNPAWKKGLFNYVAYNLNHADFQGANFYEAWLNNAKLNGSLLDNATLYAASLQGADLTNASLRGSDLRQANLSGANLCGIFFELCGRSIEKSDPSNHCRHALDCWLQKGDALETGSTVNVNV